MIDRLERTYASWSQLERVTRMPFFALDRLARSHCPRELRTTADPQAPDITSHAVVHESVPFRKVPHKIIRRSLIIWSLSETDAWSTSWEVSRFVCLPVVYWGSTALNLEIWTASSVCCLDTSVCLSVMLEANSERNLSIDWIKLCFNGGWGWLTTSSAVFVLASCWLTGWGLSIFWWTRMEQWKCKSRVSMVS